MKVSVVICTCNGAKYVTEQLNSIINQTRRVDEIIISDDNSKDDTLEIVKTIVTVSGIEYRIIENIPKKGVSRNFLDAMKLASGDYIFTADQDDIWKKNKVEVFLEKIERSKKFLYFSDGELVDSNAKSLGVSLWSTLNINYELLSSDRIERTILNRCVVTGSAMAVSSQLVKMIDCIPDSWLHDGWFAIVAIFNHSIEPVNSSTYYYRQHGNNVVGAHALTFKGRIKSWIVNISKQTLVRNQRYNRYLVAKQFSGDNAFEILDECIDFWKELTYISSNKKIASIKIIIKNALNGNYEKYYTGIRGWLRDLITVFIVR